MKKKIIFFPIILLLFTSCKIKKAPEYQRIENIKVARLNLKDIELTADAVFKNPNIIGITVKHTDIDVFHDRIFLGKATTPTFEIKRKNEFSIPLTVHFSPEKILNQEGSLRSILHIFSSRELDITYKGIITLGVLGFDYDYTFEHTQPINLNIKK
ncbi:MAG: LEA type 2 family protein [Flavobacteriales bacterium]